MCPALEKKGDALAGAPRNDAGVSSPGAMSSGGYWQVYAITSSTYQPKKPVQPSLPMSNRSRTLLPAWA
jgi:hypothetical protein